MKQFAPHYFSERYKTEWGDALNFDDKFSDPVRELFIANAGYWIDEFHCDGLRLDATHQLYDASPGHVLAAIAVRARAAARGRGIYLVSENETQDARQVRHPAQGGYGLDAVWNDDFHHTATVAMTGRNEACYTDYHGSSQEFISAAKWGFLFQGQRSKWQRKRRGSPSLDLMPSNFVVFLQNHDQIANSLLGRRIPTLTSTARMRALTALLLLGPNTPMLFQGQEGFVPNPEREETFLRCKLDFADRERNADVLSLRSEASRAGWQTRSRWCHPPASPRASVPPAREFSPPKGKATRPRGRGGGRDNRAGKRGRRCGRSGGPRHGRRRSARRAAGAWRRRLPAARRGSRQASSRRKSAGS